MRILLIILTALMATISTLSGLLMINDPSGSMLHLNTALLEESPFDNFFIPGLLLAAIVGGSSFSAVYAQIARSGNRYNWTIAAGVMVMAWLIAQSILIQAVHWLHIIFFGIGMLIILLAWQLKGKWAV
jgi:hypothetical protein